MRGSIAEGEKLDTRIRGCDDGFNYIDPHLTHRGAVILTNARIIAEGEKLDTRMRGCDEN